MNKLISGLLLLLSLNFSAQEKTVLKDTHIFKSKLEKHAKETTSIIADFTQEKYLSFMNEPQISEGKFYYQQSDKMRWEQNSPFKYILLINDGTVRIKDNGKEKNIAGANKMMGKINDLMLGLINGKLFEDKSFIVKYFKNDNYYIVEFTPKSKRMKSMFRTIELSFSKKTSRLKELTFNESSGDRSVMKFFNEKFNQTIQRSIFLKL